MLTTQRHHGLLHNLHQRSFNALYSRSLLYNACWEDPALDRRALALDSDSEVLMITSAGCNALDYALDQPRRIHAVDANPRQTALLELKIAGIRTLPWVDFWQLFGEGVHPGMGELYRKNLRRELSPESRRFWDRRLFWWSGRGWRDSFYYYGLSGFVARLINGYIRSRPRLQRALTGLFSCDSLDQQRALYSNVVAEELFPAGIRWFLNRQSTMHLLGVPYEQASAIPDGTEYHSIADFIESCIAYVCQYLPMRDNYFWRVYCEGRYSLDCCPEYLKPAQFSRLKAGLVDCITPLTATITDYLREQAPRPSHCILLDHMDWMGSAFPEQLAEEWRWLFDRGRQDMRVLFRSGARRPGFLDLPVDNGGHLAPLAEQLAFDQALAADLHRQDRVHTYASFFIGDRRAGLEAAA